MNNDANTGTEWERLANAIWNAPDSDLDAVIKCSASQKLTSGEFGYNESTDWKMRELGRMARIELMIRADEATQQRNEILAGC